MNITFLIGNGFDVGVGMHSKFEDFFPKYIDQSKSKNHNIKQLAIEIEKDCSENGYYKSWADFERALGRYTSKFDKETKGEFINQIRDFQDEFIGYLKSEENEISFEESLTIEKTMINALTQYYLVDNLAQESYEKIFALYNAHAGENHKYHFVNFNYTGVLENCLSTISDNVVRKRKYSGEKIDKIGAIVHVHGKIGSNPIIGVNDVGQIANKELAEDPQFTKLIVKPSLNQFLRQANDTNAMRIIKASNILCIYGMALGETDKKWWDSIVSWLNANKERQLVLFDYDEKYTASNPFAWIEKEDGKLEKFARYNSDKNIDIESLRSRIHIAVHKNIFQMDLRKESIREKRMQETKKMAEDVYYGQVIKKLMEKTTV